MAEPNSFEDFYDRLVALQDQAASYGIYSCIAILTTDLLERKERFRTHYHAGPIQALGMLTTFVDDVRHELEQEDE